MIRRYGLPLALCLLALIPWALLPGVGESATVGGRGGVEVLDEGSSVGVFPKLNMIGQNVSCVSNSPQADCTVDVSIVPPANLYVAGDTALGELRNVADEYVGTGVQAHLALWGTKAWIKPVSSTLGSYLTCDGSNDRIVAAHHADMNPTGDVSWSVWVKPMLTDEQEASLKAGSIAPAIFSKRLNASIPYTLWLQAGSSDIDGKLSVRLYGGSPAIDVTSTDALTNFQWSLVTVTIDELGGTDTLKIYVDNTLNTTASVAFTMITASNDLKLCASEYGGAGVYNDFFMGSVDGFRLYARELSASDVTAIYNSGVGITCASETTNLNVCYDFVEATGTAIEDDGPLGTDQDATMTNFSAPPTASSGWGFCAFVTCLHLDGTNDFVAIRDRNDFDFTSGDTMTFQMSFMNADSATVTATRTMASKGIRSTGNTNFTIDVNTSTDEIRFAYGNSSCNAIADTWTSTNFDLGSGTVQGIAVVYTFGTGSTFKMFKLSGGTATAVSGAWATNGDSAPCVNAEPLGIGSASSIESVSPWIGRVSNLQLWRGNYSSHDEASEIQTDMNSVCTSSGTGRVGCWPVNDGTGQLVTQLATTAGLGDDANSCQASNVPCRTITGAYGKLPSTFAGTSVIRVAPGVYPEFVDLRGFHPRGNAQVILRGQYGQPNTFYADGSDVARRSSTATSAATDSFPNNSHSLFTDSGAAFTSDVRYTEGWLEVTGPAGNGVDGYCLNGGDFDDRNWYTIDTGHSATQLRMVTKWSECGKPTSSSTYKIYFVDDGVVLHAGKARDYGLRVRNSSGLSFQKFAIRGAVQRNFEVYAASIDQISVFHSVDAEYTAFQTDGKSTVDRMAKVQFHDSYAGFNNWDSVVNTLMGASANRNLNGGFGSYFSSSIRNFGPLLAKQNEYAGIDIENAAHSYGLQYARITCATNANGVIVAANSNVNILAPVFIAAGSGNCLNGFNVKSGSELLMSWTPRSDTTVVSATNGVSLGRYANCLNCESFTFTTSGSFDICRSCVNLVLANGGNDNVSISGVADDNEVHAYITGPSGAFNITGFTKGQDGKLLYLYNTVAQNMTLTNDATSTAANRIYTLGFTATTGLGAVILRYDGKVQRWIVMGSQL